MRPPTRLPLFPLPDHVLLIGVPAAFRVFEPRYRALVEDLLRLPEDERWLAIPRLLPGWQQDYEASPAFSPIAAAAVARRIEAQPDGQFHLLVEGVERCRLVEVPTAGPYRWADAEPLPDLAEPAAVSANAMRTLLAALARLGDRIQLSAAEAEAMLALPHGRERLVDRIAAVVLATPDSRQALLESRCLSQRAVLLESALLALPRPGIHGGATWRPSEN